jgi:hypothetical protein
MAKDVLEALKEEIELLNELELYYKEQEKTNKDNMSLGDKMYLHRLEERKWMLKRIVNRVENNVDYKLGIKDGKVRIIAE